MYCHPVSYGYRVDEIRKIPITNIKPDIVVSLAERDSERKPVSVCLGPRTKYTYPKADPDYYVNHLTGALKRVCKNPPLRKRALAYRFLRFVKRWVRKNLVPVPSLESDDFELWLSKTHYTLARKEQLRKLLKEAQDYSLIGKNVAAKIFIKDESYPEYKHPRFIMSRSDLFKCFFGPYVKICEEVLYILPYFVKGLNERQKIERLISIMGRNPDRYVVTDYTAYESHFTRETMLMAEVELYAYIFQYHPGYARIMELADVVASPTTMRGRRLLVKVMARMSGEMSTSLGNGFTNLMTMLFVCHENGNTQVCGVVEGDDGLFSMNGEPPTAKQFEDMGFTIKLQVFSEPNFAGFCGMYFDINAKQPIMDPMKFLCNFAWAGKQYVLASDKTLRVLLRCKALSYLYQFPTCPVISELCRRVEYETREITFFQMLKRLRKMEGNYYMYQIMLEAICSPVPAREPIDYRTRQLVEQVFMLPVCDQIKMEQYFASPTLDITRQLKLPVDISRYLHDDCLEFSQFYVVDYVHSACPINIMPDVGLRKYYLGLCPHASL